MAKKSAAQIEAERADAAADEEEQEAADARARADEAAKRAQEDGGAPATVRMRRLPEFTGGSVNEADVHPAEVENMRQCGWVEVED